MFLSHEGRYSIAVGSHGEPNLCCSRDSVAAASLRIVDCEISSEIVSKADICSTALLQVVLDLSPPSTLHLGPREGAPFAALFANARSPGFASPLSVFRPSQLWAYK